MSKLGTVEACQLEHHQKVGGYSSNGRRTAFRYRWP